MWSLRRSQGLYPPSLTSTFFTGYQPFNGYGAGAELGEKALSSPLPFLHLFLIVPPPEEGSEKPGSCLTHSLLSPQASVVASSCRKLVSPPKWPSGLKQIFLMGRSFLFIPASPISVATATTFFSSSSSSSFSSHSHLF